MLGLFNRKSADHADQLRLALSADAVAIVSASCCVRGTDEVDTALDAVVREALRKQGLDWPLVTVTVTQAQSALPGVTRSLDARGAGVAQQVNELFMTHGLTAFPVLIVDQKVVAYGGVPGLDLVLRSLPGAPSGDEAAADAASA